MAEHISPSSPQFSEVERDKANSVGEITPDTSVETISTAESGLLDLSESDYAHTKLKPGEFRVLRVLPGELESSLHATLEIQDLDAEKAYPRYQAISYAWGEPVFSHLVYLTGGGYLHITPSLHVALRYLRKRHKPIRLWADGVCVDQRDDVESAQQVSRMYEIYARARNVVVWLGESCPSDARAFAQIEAGLPTCHGELDPSTDLEIPNVERWEGFCRDHPCFGCGTCDGSVSQKCFQLALHSLFRVFEKPWFTRLWVAQEVYAAHSVNIRCSYHEASWHAVEEHLSFLMRYRRFFTPENRSSDEGTRLGETLHSISAIRESYFGSSITDTLQRVLDLAERKCTRAHDRIYAPLALFNLPDGRGIQPNYSIPIGQLFANFTLAIMDNFPDAARESPLVNGNPCFLIIIAMAQRRELTTSTIPSWAPDYNAMDRATFLTGIRLYKCRRSAMLSQWPHHFSFRYRLSEDWRTLELRGRRCATVTKIVAWSEELGGRHCATVTKIVALKEIPKRFVLLPSREETEEVPSKKIERASHEQLSSFLLRAYPSGETVEKYENFTQMCEDPLAKEDGVEISGLLEGGYKYMLGHVTVGNSNWLAWVPRGTRAGDQLTYFSGMPLPVAVRRVPGRNAWQLIDECWVPGLRERQLIAVDEDERRRIDAALELVLSHWEGCPLDDSDLDLWRQWGFNEWNLKGDKSHDKFGELAKRATSVLVAWDEENLDWIALE